MYTTRNFKTKKALKDAVAAWNEWQMVKATAAKLAMPAISIGAVLLAKTVEHAPEPVTFYQPGPFGGKEPKDGQIVLEGPHYPEPHRWYARVDVKGGVIVKVR